MSFVVADTIVAIASARGPGARTIIRLSGPDTAVCLRDCFSCELPWYQSQLPIVAHGEIRLVASNAVLPCDLYFWPTHRSYTRQPAGELHLLGSIPLAEATLETLCQSGARLARPGEFTMRAFLAGRIDLPQAEAVLGVIDATNQRALDRALRQLAGGLSAQLGQLRDQLLDLLADVEAGLDFVEEDIEFVTQPQILNRLDEASAIAAAILQRMQRRSTSVSTTKVVLLGLPNVGKSSLFNALCDRHQAIVSAASGTTRDYVAGTLRAMSHQPNEHITIIDTAGVASDVTQDTAQSSQTVTELQWQDADIVLICLDASQPLSISARQLLDNTHGRPRLIVGTKMDLAADPSHEHPPWQPLASTWYVSSLTGQGVEELITAIHQAIAATHDDETQVVQLTAGRCRDSLRQTLSSFALARTLAMESAGNELLAAELRHGLDHLAQIVGTIYTDDVLDRIFGRFCIGK